MRLFSLILSVVMSCPVFADEANRLIILAAAARAKEKVTEPAVDQPAKAEPFTWQPYSEIKKQRKGGLVFLWGDNCVHCPKAEESLRDPAVIEKLSRIPVCSKVKLSPEWTPIFESLGKKPFVPALALVDPDNKIRVIEACPQTGGEILELFLQE